MAFTIYTTHHVITHHQTLETYQQFKEIPRKLVVAKRLAQCLNPALPTGVHQRALDVYSHVFAVLGVRLRIYTFPDVASCYVSARLRVCIATLPYGPQACSHSLSTQRPPSR